MHLELAVPALFLVPPAPLAARPPRLPCVPALERLLARSRRVPAPVSVATPEDWLAQAFGLGTLPAGALTALEGGLAPESAMRDRDYPVPNWLRADPVHLRADRDRLLLIPAAALDIEEREARELCAALNLHFAGQLSLHAVAPQVWVMHDQRLPPPVPPSSRAPLAIAGLDVDAELPDKSWHVLLNEIQMALHEHPVNKAREELGRPTINSLWPWGGGGLATLPRPLAGRWQTRWQTLSGEDPPLRGLARLAGLGSLPASSGASPWLASAPAAGRHLVLLDSLRIPAALGDGEAYVRELRALEDGWFAPLVAALASGRIGMLTLHLPEAGESFEALRSDLRRFWRRSRPLASYGGRR